MLGPEDSGEIVSVVVTTPDSKGDFLRIVLWEQSSPASCCLSTLFGFFPTSIRGSVVLGEHGVRLLL
jgi:hypothetical protein